MLLYTAMTQPEAKDTTTLRSILLYCCYCAIVPARVLLNGGILAGNKLMSGSTGGLCYYVRPPLIRIFFFLLRYGLLEQAPFFFFFFFFTRCNINCVVCIDRYS